MPWDRYRPLEQRDADHVRGGNFEVYKRDGLVGCRDCDRLFGQSYPVGDLEAHDRWHDEGCPELVAMAAVA